MDKYIQELKSIGPETPEWVSSMLSRFGTNPYGDPVYRLIWSERKFYHAFGEMVPQYDYFEKPGWLMEHWTSPEVDAGSKSAWEEMNHFGGGFLGPYPDMGFYNMVDPRLPEDWIPSEDTVSGYCIALDKSLALSPVERSRIIREHLEKKAAVEREEVNETIEELMDSASKGVIQQSVSGPKNNFRTVDDYVRDLERSPLVKNVTLPKRGGKIMSEGL